MLTALIEGSTDFGDPELLASNRKDGCYPTEEFLRTILGNDKVVTSSNLKQFPNFGLVPRRNGRAYWHLGTPLYSLMNRDNAGSSRTILRSTGAE